MIKCPKCNSMNLDFMLSCSTCGQRLWAARSNCKALMPHEAKFCGSCGRRRKEEEALQTERVSLASAVIEPEEWFKGRKNILAKLPAALEEAANGEGRAVFIQGPAGCGKSAIIRQFENFARDNGFKVISAKCTVTTRNIVFYPLLEVVRQIAGINNEDDKNQIGLKMSGLVKYGLTQDEISVLAQYFGVEYSVASFAASEREHSVSSFFYCVVRLTRNLAMKTPTVIIIDDLQHIDALTRKLLAPIISVIKGMRALLMLGSRELAQTEPEEKHVYYIKAPSLEARELLRMIEERLKVETLPKEIAQELFMSSEGNPGFAAQLINYLFEAGIAVRDGGTLRLDPQNANAKRPATFEALLKARLELLSGSQKELLMLASILGDESTPENLHMLFRHKNVFRDDCEALVAKGFIERRGEEGRERLVIKESVVAQILDAFISSEVRQSLEPVVGKIIQEKGAYIKWTKDFMVAYHMSYLPPTATESVYTIERLAWAMLDARQSGLAISAFQTASQILRSIIQKRPKGSEEAAVMEQKLAHALLGLGKAYLDFGNSENVMKTLELSLKLARKGNFHFLALDVIARQLDLMKNEKRFSEAHAVADVAIQIAKGVKFNPGVARMYFLKGQLYESEGKEDIAIGMYSEALRIAEQKKIRIRADDSFAHKAALAIASIMLRREMSASADEAKTYLGKALDYIFISRDINALQGLMDLYGRYYYEKKDNASAIKYCDIALKVARARLDYRDMARLSYTMGYYYGLLGKDEESELYFGESLSMAIQCNWPAGIETAQKALRRLKSKRNISASFKNS